MSQQSSDFDDPHNFNRDESDEEEPVLREEIAHKFEKIYDARKELIESSKLCF